MRYISFEIVFGVNLPSMFFESRDKARVKAIELRQAGYGVTCIARDVRGVGRAFYLTPKSLKFKPAIPARR